MEFPLPARLTSDFDGYEYLINLLHNIEISNDNVIILDFKQTDWFEGNVAAILGAITVTYMEKGKTVHVRNLNQNIESVLRRNHFLCEFKYDGIIDSKGTIITYKKFTQYQDIEFLNYIDDELLSKPDFPKHSKLLGKKINESIFELFENARTHGNCKHIFTCGQYYPSGNKGKRLDITIVDLGVTIKTNVNNYLNNNLTGVETIDWAMQYGNTTKTGNVTGGLGLDIVKEFISLNNGKIQFVSADGYLEYTKNGNIKNSFKHQFGGTIVNIEFNLSDRKSYTLKEEISLDNIF